jgi:hypothetical protein
MSAAQLINLLTGSDVECRQTSEEHRRIACLQKDEFLLRQRMLKEARLALAMQFSELTEIQAHLSETRHLLSELRKIKNLDQGR